MRYLLAGQLGHRQAARRPEGSCAQHQGHQSKVIWAPAHDRWRGAWIPPRFHPARLGEKGTLLPVGPKRRKAAGVLARCGSWKTRAAKAPKPRFRVCSSLRD